MQGRLRLRKQRDQGNKNDHFGHDHAAIRGGDGVDSEGNEIKLLVIDRVDAILARFLFRQCMQCISRKLKMLSFCLCVTVGLDRLVRVMKAKVHP